MDLIIPGDVNPNEYLGKLPKQLDGMSPQQKMELLELLEEREKRLQYSGYKKWFVPGTETSLENLPKHRAFFAAGKDYRVRALIGGNRCLAEGTLVATPLGPVAIEDLEVGDTVYDRYGEPTKVSAVWDNGEKEVFNMTSRGKVMFACTPNHELDCLTKTSKKVLWRSDKVKEERVRADEQHENVAVRRAYAKSPLGGVHEPHAYVIGAMFGDGCCTCGTKTKIAISSANAAIPERIADILGVDYEKNKGANYTYMIHFPTFNHYDDWMKDKKAHQKTIDLSVVKTWDRESLLQFVAGLVDTDGGLSKGKDGHSLGLTMQALPVVEAFAYACTALWMDSPTIHICNGKHYVNGPCYYANIRNPWKVKLACDELRPYLVHKYKAEIDYSVFGGKRSFKDQIKINKTGEGYVVRTYDITVEHPEHFYLLANGISVSNCGKSICTTYEAALHATGDYRSVNWEGREFDKPTNIYVVGDTNETTKNILQSKLLGPPGTRGTGMLPLKTILGTTAKAGVSGAVSTIQVRHVSGGVSNISLLSYQQGMEAFYGVELEFAALDEMPPHNIYSEILTRTMTTNGMVSLSFTPLKGYTPLVISLFQHAELLCGAEPLEGSEILFDKNLKRPDKPHKAIVQIGWDDVSWLDEKTKQELLAETPPNLRLPRSQGKPTYGEGAAFPVAREKITYRPGDVDILPSWPRVYGLDVGWTCTAAVWAAYDPAGDVIYIYDEYIEHEKMPGYHAYNIQSRGKDIIGAIDPAAYQSGQDDGKKLFNQYKAEGLKLIKAENARLQSYKAIWQAMVLGKIKISTTCTHLLGELSIAQVDDKGELKSKNKYHAYDATRYAFAAVKKAKAPQEQSNVHDINTRGYLKF